jgi:RNA polymerase sigma factor (sigma-70 family)
MAARAETLLQYIRRLVVRPGTDDDTDAGLLQRFTAHRDETAFAALVERHGPMVLQVCRRVLGNMEDAEDAFQAAFLILARKAATVRPREALPAWLHGVARRVALKARSARARRFREDRSLAAPPADSGPDPLADLSARELLTILDEEVNRLPRMYRLPVVLCCLEGRSLEETARYLGWTPGSVKGRLERGRKRLHDRLVRRGLTLSAALTAAEVSRSAASAFTVAQLAAATVRGALRFAARSAAPGDVSPAAVALAGEVIRGMALARLPILTALLLAICLLATGFLSYKAVGPSSTEPPRLDSLPLPPEEEPAPAAAARVQNQPLAIDLFNTPVAVRGRVLDPEGAPVNGAKLYVGYSPRPSPFIRSKSATSYTPRATSGEDGRFQFTFSRSELDAKALDTARPAVIAVASGFGPDWAVIGDDAEDVELSLKLVRELPLNGRVLDSEGKPVAGAKVRVESVYSAGADDVSRHLRGEAGPDIPWVTWIGAFPGQPAVFTTDEDGRFHGAGFGSDRMIWLAVEAPDIGHTFLAAVTRLPEATAFARGMKGASFEYTASAARRIRGVVRDKAAGKPLPGVLISATLNQTYATAVTDKSGCYELPRCMKAQGYVLTAQPQTGLPYFTTLGSVTDGPGIGPLTLDFDLVGGIAVHGRVIDRATREPPKAALVEYYPLYPNADSALLSNGSAAASSAVTQPDGSYRLVALPGPGIVCVAASPHDVYAVAVLDGEKLAKILDEGKQSTNPKSKGNNERVSYNPRTAFGPAGQSVLCVNRYHALALIKPERTLESMSLDLDVQPARTLRGTVLGPDRKPLTGARVVGLTATPDSDVLGSATFAVMGLNPRRSRELYFHHEEQGLGRFLTLQGNENNPQTIQLVPCGAAIGRIMDKGNKPVADLHVRLSRVGEGYCLPVATTATDADGRFRMSGLVPGVKYNFVLMDSRRLRTEVGEVEVRSGQIKDLGELALDK